MLSKFEKKTFVLDIKEQKIMQFSGLEKKLKM